MISFARFRRRPGAITAAAVACAVMVLLPGCGTLQLRPEPPPRVVTVTEPDGRTYLASASSMGIAHVDRCAGEFCGPDFCCPGDGWTQLIILGFYVLGYAIYYIGYGLYWCVDSMFEADSGYDEDECQDEP